MRYGGMKVVSVLIASVMALTAGLVAKPAAAESSQASIT